ncbi:MAG: hypothetical protein AB8G23_13950 [Myxococcota bacterium]
MGLRGSLPWGERREINEWVLAALGVGGLIGMFLLGCAGNAPAPEIIPLGPEFSGRAAAAHVRAVDEGPDRSAKSEGGYAAHVYLSDAFRAVGAEVETLADGTRRHLVAKLPGKSEDAVLLVAADPALAEAAWTDGTGAGVLVELARILALEPLPYTVYFGLADLRAGLTESSSPTERPLENADAMVGQSLAAPPSVSAPVMPGSLRASRKRLYDAGESLANAFAMSSTVGNLRAVIALDAAARPGLRLARDLRSHPLYRGLFWASAANLGHSSIFPEDGGWASPRSLHSSFHEIAQGRVLGLVDEQVARADLYSAPISAPPAEETLLGLGLVTADALGGLMERLAKIDAFTP